MIITSVTLLPLFLDPHITRLDVAILLSILLLLIGIIIWPFIGIRYVLTNDYLYVKGGPFRSKIPYGDITKITSTNDMLTGYRIMSSKDGVEIYYKKGMLGSVKISPCKKETFLHELHKRCPPSFIILAVAKLLHRYPLMELDVALLAYDNLHIQGDAWITFPSQIPPSFIVTFPHFVSIVCIFLSIR
ncbi:PH domain-containing protein [Gracilibacillus sp. JCM 18860]|uniref:PH domain-containing protein n=1 Tax=Gracilibacillus sp. JCM 18860 TaxID=1306159 RepID=UPI0032612E2E